MTFEYREIWDRFIVDYDQVQNPLPKEGPSFLTGMECYVDTGDFTANTKKSSFKDSMQELGDGVGEYHRSVE